jgi:SAM-dependent methyltransferase
MRETYVAMMKKELNAYAEEYFQDYDIFEAETKLLKPILVCVSEDPAQRELMRDYGTDVVLEKLSVEDMQQLVELVGRVKASAASLMPEKLKRIKKEFYKSVEDKLDARSEITADTEREIAFLEEIFRRHGNIKKVLDVGCGNGRIDLPLAEKGYEVLGLDANEQFLQSALKKSIEKNTPGVEFKKGDIIDYSDAVKPGTRDAVIYTWHTILEAFGPGNTLHSLGNAWSALRPGGVVVFDQPTRENPLMEDGWYGDNPDNEHRYLSYIMTEEEIEFILKMAGFEDVEIKKWQTKPSEEYPGGMCKLTISAIKPEIDMIAEGKIGMYRKLKEEQESLMAANRKRAEEDMAWVDEFDKRKSV